MRLQKWTTGAVLAVFGMAVCAQTPQPAQAGQKRKPMIVVISLDVFGASLLRAAAARTHTARAHEERQLCQQHAAHQCHRDLAQHTAMVTGVDAAKRGLIANARSPRSTPALPLHVEFHADTTALVRVPTCMTARTMPAW